MSTDMVQSFNKELSEAQKSAPGAEWLRLDQLSGLASNDNFCDLVHMNVSGQQVATKTFENWLKQLASR